MCLSVCVGGAGIELSQIDARLHGRGGLGFKENVINI